METFPEREKIQQELSKARAARAAGNEGMARVCARRAAGIVAEVYLRRRGIHFPGPNVYERLKFLREMPEISPKAKEILHHFLVKINPDKTLPVDADLIADVYWLEDELLK